MLNCRTVLHLLVLVKLNTLALAVNVKIFFRGNEDLGSIIETGVWVRSACYEDCQLILGEILFNGFVVLLNYREM